MEISTILWLLIFHLCSILHDVSAFNVVCYFESWWIYRPGWAKFQPSYLKGLECTHIIYAFTELRPSNYQMYEADSSEYASYAALHDLKRQRPGLKTLLAIGGAGKEENRKISTMARNPTLTKNFVRSATAYIRQNNFDGLDVDWEYPRTAVEKQAFSNLLKNLRQAFEDEAVKSGKERLLLSSAVSAWDDAIDRAYDVGKISGYLDFISVMAYDLHGTWQDKTGHNAPLRNSGDKFNVEYAMNYWLSKGAPRDKLNVGIPTYGRGFMLSNPNNNGFGASVTGGTPMEQYSQWPGVAGYFELCSRLDSGEGLIVYPNSQGAPYYTSGTYWMGYDNPESVREKAKYIVAQRFAGAMIWALGLDDFAQTCQSSKTPYPIIQSVVSVFKKYQKPQMSTSSTFPWWVETTTHSSTRSKSKPETTVSTTTKSQIVSDIFCLNKPRGKYPDPVDCNIFYECRDGHKYKFLCPGSLCFDKRKGYCDWPAVQQTQPSKVATTTTRKPTTTTRTTRRTTTTPSFEVLSCGTGSGLYPDPKSCHKFILCFAGRSFSFSCPKGLYYNAGDKTCDWFSRVGC